MIVLRPQLAVCFCEFFRFLPNIVAGLNSVNSFLNASSFTEVLCLMNPVNNKYKYVKTSHTRPSDPKPKP